MRWLKDLRYEIGWTRDHSVAYLFARKRSRRFGPIARWIRGRPELTTFDPAGFRLGSAAVAEGGTLYEAFPID